jgi:hypothetical protein
MIKLQTERHFPNFYIKCILGVAFVKRAMQKSENCLTFYVMEHTKPPKHIYTTICLTYLTRKPIKRKYMLLYVC